MNYRAESAVSPLSGLRTWMVVDENFTPQPDVLKYALSLVAAERSTNTCRSYMPKIATFLNWCSDQAVDWRTTDVAAMARYKRSLEMRVNRQGDPITGKTINIYLVAATEFIRFCAAEGLIAEEMGSRFHVLKFIRETPSGMSPSEDGSHHFINARRVKAREDTKGPEVISARDLSAVEQACRNPREHLLFVVLRDTAIRIGEALGLWRDDLHFLPDSTALGCQEEGAHLHVRRRLNSNGALAKSKTPRVVPVDSDVVNAYLDYMDEREAQVPHSTSPFVFLNLYARADQRDTPLKYGVAKTIVNRWARAADGPVRPHMFRHTTATGWIRSGSGVDVVKELLGHASASSTHVYLHPTSQDARVAVDRLSAERAKARTPRTEDEGQS